MTEPRIQILSLREFVVKKTGEVKLHDRTHYQSGWRADSVQELFKNIEKYIDDIPKGERYNMYYTAAECIDSDKPRYFTQQNIIPFDIDGTDLDKTDEYLKLFVEETGLDIEKCGVVLTGNGIHIIVMLDAYMEDSAIFDTHRGHYKALLGKLNTRLFEEGLIGEYDNSVFSNRRLLRLPLTENRKKDKGIKQSTLLKRDLQPQRFKLTELSGLPDLLAADYINVRAFAKMPKPDKQAVLNECLFLDHAKENQATLSEPEWYAMLSIVGRLDGGAELVHEFSSQHPQYTREATDTKLEQALDASGPRTCENINGYYAGCLQCPHFGQIRSPIAIKGKDYVRTKDTGFWNVVISKDGEVKRLKPNYDDLVMHYDAQHEHVVIRETELVYHWSGKYWKQQERIDLNSFIESVMEPKPTQTHCQEFASKMKRTNIRDTQWLVVEGKVNLNNGVLDTRNMSFDEHKHTNGFPYCLPFDYKAGAKCPQWLEFIKEVTMNRDELIGVLQEFMGLCLGYVDPTFVQRSAILLGSGANGKSVYLNVLKNMLGTENYSVIPLQEAANNRTARVALVNKMANITEETPRGAFMDSSFFKDIVSGGEIQAHKMYHGPFKFKNTAKIIMACNELPELNDITNGMRRRLLVIPFERTFSRDEQDPLLHVKLEAESSGIFNWALKGLQRLQRNHYQFSDGQIVSEFFSKTIVEDNPIIDWIYDRLNVDIIHKGTSPVTLYEDYKLYANDKGMTQRRFTKYLKMYVSDELAIPNLDTLVLKDDNRRSYRLFPMVELKKEDVNNAAF